MASRAVPRRGLALTAAALVMIVGLAAAVWLGDASGEAKPDPGRPGGGQFAVGRTISRPGGARREWATSCRVTPTTSPHAGKRPLLVAAGASFTAGVGAPEPADGWAVRLAELIRWRAVTLGVPGIGYTRPGAGHLGPLSRLLDHLHLAALHPALVIIQAGHDDLRVPAAVEAEHVAGLVGRLRREAPAARLAFLTVFSPSTASAATLTAEAATDSAIVSAIRKSDPRAIVIDPLHSHWRFPRAIDGLHPTARGDLLIAGRVASALRRAGVVATSAAQPARARVACAVFGGVHDHLGRAGLQALVR
jgi:lysophospholipase L1-like esterase